MNEHNNERTNYRRRNAVGISGVITCLIFVSCKKTSTTCEVSHHMIYLWCSQQMNTGFVYTYVQQQVLFIKDILAKYSI